MSPWTHRLYALAIAGAAFAGVIGGVLTTSKAVLLLSLLKVCP